MKQSQRIIKNVLAGGIAVGAGGVLQLAVAVVFVCPLGRSVSDFGIYSFILAFAVFSSSFWLIPEV